MKKAAIYGRCASKDRAEQAIERQVNSCTEYAKSNDIQIVGEYIDKAMSGRSAKRPAFLRMIADAGKGIFDYIIVYRLDGFSRSMIDSITYRQILKQCGVSVVSVTENITNAPEGDITKLLLNDMAEFFSAEDR